MRAFHSPTLGSFGDAGTGYAQAGAATLNVIGDLINLFTQHNPSTNPTTPMAGGSCGSGYVFDPSTGQCVPLGTVPYGQQPIQQQGLSIDNTMLLVGGGLLVVLLASKLGK